MKCFCCSELSYLVNTGEVLDQKAQEDPGYHSTGHLQDAPQEAVPGGAWSQAEADIRGKKLLVAPRMWINLFCMPVTKALAQIFFKKYRGSPW